MEFLQILSITLFVIWCVSEIGISLFSAVNKSTVSSSGADKFSFLIIWLSTIPPILFAFLNQKRSIFSDGFGSSLFPFSGYLGCFFIVFGVSIRLTAGSRFVGISQLPYPLWKAIRSSRREFTG